MNCEKLMIIEVRQVSGTCVRSTGRSGLRRFPCYRVQSSSTDGMRAVWRPCVFFFFFEYDWGE